MTFTDPLLHIIEITIQLVMLIGVIFGGARWLGETNEILRRLARDCDKHFDADVDQFRHMEGQITGIQVELARQGSLRDAQLELAERRAGQPGGRV